ALAEKGLQILTAADADAGMELIARHNAQIVLLDLVMPKVSGMELLDRILDSSPATDVILITGHYSAESAVEAIKRGACDYLNKPISIPLLRQRIDTLVEEARGRQLASELDVEILKTCQFEGMVGRSPLMLEVFARIRRVAPHFRTVLLTGATGTGKELVAH